jgi:geranylgeranyl diphosphate synthase, type II
MQDNSNKYQAVYKREFKRIEKIFEKAYVNSKPKSLYEPINYILQGGGKRIRPFLVLCCAHSVGKKFSDVSNAALAVEILHNFTLVHDDIMDNADKRRGRVTLHIRNGVDTAILAGDIMAVLAYETLLKDCGNNAKDVLAVFTRGIIEICEGQGLDKDFETRSAVSIKEYKEMIYKKTAALLEMCCLIGAQLGKGKKEEIKALGAYGKNLGMAFQIQDDLLDILADEKEFGKSIGGDLVEGKKTYLFLRALEKAGGTDKKMLLEVIRKKGIARKNVGKYKELYRKLNVIEDAKKEIKIYTDKAISSLKIIKRKDDTELLKWMALTLLQRNK